MFAQTTICTKLVYLQLSFQLKCSFSAIIIRAQLLESDQDLQLLRKLEQCSEFGANGKSAPKLHFQTQWVLSQLSRFLFVLIKVPESDKKRASESHPTCMDQLRIIPQYNINKLGLSCAKLRSSVVSQPVCLPLNK